MSKKPFAKITGCILELGLEEAGRGEDFYYWERITAPDGRVLRNVSTNTDHRDDMEDDPIDTMVMVEAQKRIRNSKGRLRKHGKTPDKR